MATVFKNLLSNDVATTRTLLNEAIPITGSIVSGTYSDKNIKYYSHGMFESVYDYPYLSSSANHIFDITYGYSSTLSSSSDTGTKESIPGSFGLLGAPAPGMPFWGARPFLGCLASGPVYECRRCCYCCYHYYSYCSV